MTTPARTLAVQALTQWEEGRDHLEEILEKHLRPLVGLERRERALAWQIALGVVRFRSLLDARLLLAMHAPLPAKRHFVWSALRAALFQAQFLRVPERAAIHEAVALVKESRESAMAGFANAVLRRAVTTPLVVAPGDLATAHAYPPWLVARWSGVLSESALLARLEAGNRIAPLTLHVNQRLMDRATLLMRLADAAIPARAAQSPGAILLEGRPVMEGLPGYREGHFFAQDQGAQQAVALLAPQAGESVLDACAAPGGKTAQLLAIPGVRVTAVEKEPRRMARLKENLDRLTLLAGEDGPILRLGDVATLPDLPLFHKALVDAPCSGTGVIRRHPEIKWRLQAGAIPRLAAEQLRLLTAVARQVVAGGVVVYATCSLEPEENDGVVQAFLAAQPQFAEAQRWQVEPGGEEEMDGHFAVRLVRQHGP